MEHKKKRYSLKKWRFPDVEVVKTNRTKLCIHKFAKYCQIVNTAFDSFDAG